MIKVSKENICHDERFKEKIVIEKAIILNNKFLTKTSFFVS